MERTAQGNGKVAIVTGAASGMGEALATDLIQQGWNVACLDVNVDAGKKLVAQLGDRAIFIQCNVASYDDQARAFTETFNKWGRLDALLENAGIVDRSSIYILAHRGKKEVPPAPDLSCTDVDYKGVVYGVQLAIHFMRQNPTPGGAIVATASVAAIHPHPTFPEYCGIKAGVMNFVRCMAPLLKANENITINCVNPGLVPTPIIPKIMIDACAPDHRTPASTIVKAYNTFINDPSRNGQVCECSADKLFFIPYPEYANGAATKRAATVFEPMHVMLHGEETGLEGTFR